MLVEKFLVLRKSKFCNEWK